MEHFKRISLIEICLAICIGRLFFIHEPTFVDVGILFVAMLGFMHREFQIHKGAVFEEKLAKLRSDVAEMLSDQMSRLNKADDRIDQCVLGVEECKSTQLKLERAADDIKKVISTSNLKTALYTRMRNKESV